MCYNINNFLKNNGTMLITVMNGDYVHELLEKK